jgi:hypothetical protein
MIQNEPNCAPLAPKSIESPIEDLQRQVDAASEFGLFPPIDVEVLGFAPTTILVSPRANVKSDDSDLSGALGFIADTLFPRQSTARDKLYRGVELHRLGQVSRFGCDVTPSTAPIYASEYPKKALEYGELVMVFDSARLDRTYRDVPKSENPRTLSRLREKYPTVIEKDGNRLWFSMLSPDDNRTGTIYEGYYTFYIPGDPHEALLMLFLVGKDPNALRSAFQQLQ